MKRVVLIILCIIVSVVVLRTIVQPAALEHTSIAQSPTPTRSSSTPPATIVVNDATYGYVDIIVPDPSAIAIIPNAEDKFSLAKIMEIHSCDSALNAGFYDTSFQPLGLLIADGEQMSGAIASDLLNAYFWVDTSGSFGISDTYPSGLDIRSAVQNGPYLIYNGSPLSLRIRDDEKARRITAAIDSKSRLHFYAIYNPQSVFDGPTLADLPEVLHAIGMQSDTPLDAAFNLDGGSASAFYTDGTRLGELVPVGAAICIQ